MELTERLVKALRVARDSLADSSDAISAAYDEAERSGDYSDADELAADHRECLHDELESLLQAFAEDLPGIFD